MGKQWMSWMYSERARAMVGLLGVHTEGIPAHLCRGPCFSPISSFLPPLQEAGDGGGQGVFWVCMEHLTPWAWQ